MSFFKASPAKAGFFNASKPSFPLPKADANVDALPEMHSREPVRREDIAMQEGNSTPPLPEATILNSIPNADVGTRPINEEAKVAPYPLAEAGSLSVQPNRPNPIPQTPKGIGYRIKEKSHVLSIPSTLRGGTFPKPPSFGNAPVVPGKAPLPSSFSRTPTISLANSSAREVHRPGLSGQRQPLTDITPRQLLGAERADLKTFSPAPSTVRQDSPEHRLDDDVGKRVQELLTSVQELHDSVTESVATHKIAIASIKTR